MSRKRYRNMRNAGEVISFKTAYVYKLTDIVKVSWKLNAEQTFFVTNTCFAVNHCSRTHESFKKQNLLGEEAHLWEFEKK